MAGLAVATALVGGCSSKHEANHALPSASETSASPSLEPLGPADLPMPAEAREETADGFNAFAHYYIDLINRLETDLDSTYLRQFSRGCATCDRLASDAEGDATKGYSYEGGTITITALAAAHMTAQGAETAFTVDQAAYSVLDSSGTPVQGLNGEAAADLPGGMAGVWAYNHWVVTNLTFG